MHTTVVVLAYILVLQVLTLLVVLTMHMTLHYQLHLKLEQQSQLMLTVDRVLSLTLMLIHLYLQHQVLLSQVVTIHIHSYLEPQMVLRQVVTLIISMHYQLYLMVHTERMRTFVLTSMLIRIEVVLDSLFLVILLQVQNLVQLSNLRVLTLD